jgi:hypothetical protein
MAQLACIDRDRSGHDGSIRGLHFRALIHDTRAIGGIGWKLGLVCRGIGLSIVGNAGVLFNVRITHV